MKQSYLWADVSIHCCSIPKLNIPKPDTSIRGPYQAVSSPQAEPRHRAASSTRPASSWAEGFGGFGEEKNPGHEGS